MEEMNMQQHETEMIHEQTETSQPQSEETPIQSQEQYEQDIRDRNFLALRDKAERAERERDEALRYIQQVQMQQQHQMPVDEDQNLAPDDLTEKRYVDKKFNDIKNQLKQYEQYTIESRIRSQFTDFDSVVTPETIENLKNAYPEIAQSLHATPDLYNKAVSTYNIIKRFGIAKPHNPQSEYEKSLLQRNASKPRATNSVSPQQGETPLNKANEWANGVLTPERKAQLYREMMEAKNNW